MNKPPDSLELSRTQQKRIRAQLWLAVWRHSRVGWLGIGFGIALFSAMATAIVWEQIQAPTTTKVRMMTAALFLPSFLTLFAGLSTGLLGACWLRLGRAGALRLQPGAQAAARRLGLEQVAALWLVVALPSVAATLVLAGTDTTAAVAWPLLAMACGLPALGMALGLATVVFASKTMSTVLAAVFFASMMVPGLTRDGPLSVSEPALRLCLAAVGLLGLPALAWVLQKTFRRLLLADTAETPSLEWSELLKPRAVVSAMPSGWCALWCPGPPHTAGWRAQLIQLLVPCLLVFFAFTSKNFPWNGRTASTMGLWLSLVWLGIAMGAWGSVRLALVPGGWHRDDSRRRLLIRPLMLGLSSFGTAMAVFLVLVAVVWEPPWKQWAALPMGIAAPAVLMCCTAVALTPVMRASRRLWVALTALGLLAVALGCMVHFDWPLEDAHPWSWLARSVCLLVLAVSLGWLALAASRRAWRRIDWGQQPALPAFALYPAKAPSRSSAR